MQIAIRKASIFLLPAVFIFMGVLLVSVSVPHALHTFSSGRLDGITVVIDAGHGGEDGGAVSPSGTVESRINLQIASKLDNLMHLYGVNTVMLRHEDVSLHDADAETLRQKKKTDLKNRVAIINETKNGILISIHQNIYNNRRQSGAQVFYADETSSRDWAVLTQDLLRNTLDPANKRKAAKIPNSIYLMNNVTRPALLVECGFLSNPKEERLLTDGAYQIKIAAVLAASALQYYGQ